MTDLTTITTDDKLAALATSTVLREREIEGYQVNINNYTAMLASMPQGAWPDTITQYKGKTASDLLSQGVDVDLVTEVSQYTFRDQVALLLATEKIEQAKAKAVYAALVAQLPTDGSAPALLATAKTDLDTPTEAAK